MRRMSEVHDEITRLGKLKRYYDARAKESELSALNPKPWIDRWRACHAQEAMAIEAVERLQMRLDA